MTKKKALLLGGTGAMGVYLVPELIAKGYEVYVTTRANRRSGEKGLNYIKGDAHSQEFLSRILESKKYDLIVDFMSYSTEEFQKRRDLLLGRCRHYIFLSSYRIFAKAEVIKEDSPRLLDTLKDQEYLATDEYALTKARQEDILRASQQKNWTIVRPSITYSKERFQFGTVEADVVIWRALRNLPVLLPAAIKDKKNTMTWAGDTARIIAKLALNRKAFSDDFNIGTTENYTWGEIADIYGEVIGLKVKYVDLDKYVEATGYPGVEYLINYNRIYNRVFDNSKVLRVTGEKSENFMRLREGLAHELEKFKRKPTYRSIDYGKHGRIDRLTGSIARPGSIPREHLGVYLRNRFPRSVSAVRYLSKLREKVRIRTRIRSLAREAFQYRVKILSYKNRLHVNRIARSPDGAILTILDYNNYGNILQRYALQRFLDKSGYEFISYEHNLPKNSKLSDNKFTNIADFVNRYIAIKNFDINDDYPAYIVGSDQVWRNWRYKDEYEDLGLFFFNFIGDSEKNLVAYAVSFGKDTTEDAGLSAEFIKKIEPHVKRISHIAAREDSGIKIIREKWGVHADLVIDPTLLLDNEDYDMIINESTERDVSTAGVFSYLLGPNQDILNFINMSAERIKTNEQIISPYVQDGVLPSMAYWLKSVRDARLVITDSFHCTVFSILNNTPFIVVENPHGGVARLQNLLAEFGIKGRFVKTEELSELEPDTLDSIDWKRVNNKLNELRESSSNWLIEAVENQ